MQTWIPDSRNFAYLTWKQVDALSRDKTLLVLPTLYLAFHQERAHGAAPPGLANAAEGLDPP